MTFWGVVLASFLGCFFAITFIGSYFFWALGRLEKSGKTGRGRPVVPSSQDPGPKVDVKKVKDLILKAEEIAKKQIELSGAAQQPSKGAAHSRWKNDIIGLMKQLESDKMDIFRAIVAEGYDPKIGVMMPDGVVEQFPMSEAVKMWEEEDAMKQPPPPPQNHTSKRLFVVKDDGKSQE